MTKTDLAADIVDLDLGVRDTTAITRPDVGLVFAIPVATSRTLQTTQVQADEAIFQCSSQPAALNTARGCRALTNAPDSRQQKQGPSKKIETAHFAVKTLARQYAARFQADRNCYGNKQFTYAAHFVGGEKVAWVVDKIAFCRHY